MTPTDAQKHEVVALCQDAELEVFNSAREAIAIVVMVAKDPRDPASITNRLYRLMKKPSVTRYGVRFEQCLGMPHHFLHFTPEAEKATVRHE